MEALNFNYDSHYTYSDYLKWGRDERFELIDGSPYLMSPAPSSTHQKISMEISRQIANFLKGKPCQVFPAPFDVRLNAEGKDDTVVQPDISVICDKTKIDEKGCKGVPDMVVEITSPSSSKCDGFLKFNKYLQSGVREYWIVRPEDKAVSVHLLENNKYVTSVYSEIDEVEVQVLPGCIINLGEVFGLEEEESSAEKVSN